MPEVFGGTPVMPPRAALGSQASYGTLPRPLTSFIGRERELALARRLLRGSCLVTLTGPGGSGKTRLCIALAAEVAAEYPDGVYFVSLAPVQDPGLVPSTIAQNIGLQDARDRPLMEHLINQLRERQLLIVLDNFEHLLPGAPVVTRLLQETSALRILVSSRSSLRISGEQECPVPPLALPDTGIRPTAGSVAGCESVRLFAERASAADPGFTLTDENAPAVVQIAHRLDGLPLAIELAAARVKVLPPEAILPRLEHSLGLLTGGSRDLPDRLRTLRGTIAWSYDLLTNGARRLLAACSVFAGGASLEAIETVCESALDLGVPVIDGVAELVDQSLLRQVGGPGLPRYLMLETIREFAAERLDQTPEADRIRGAHAGAFLALAGADGGSHVGLARKEWLERLDADHNNIRAALNWYRDHDPAAALRLAAAMPAFWSLRGHHTEGRQRLAELLAAVPAANVTRVRALNGAGWLAIDQGGYDNAADLLGESIELSRALGDTVGEGIATVCLGRCKLSSLAIAEAQPDVERAAELLAGAGDPSASAFSLLYLGLAAQFTDRLELACDYFARCGAMAAELGLEPLRARARLILGCGLVDLGELAAARAAMEEGLPGSIAVGDRWIVPIGLSGFAGYAASTGRPQLAIRLAGASDAYQEANEFTMPGPIHEMVARWLAPARAKAGHALVRNGTITNPLKRKVRDIVLPALGRTPVIQRRAARRISQIYVAYPPGPLARPARGRASPRPGQRMPDIGVRAGGRAATLHGVLRGGRHVLVIPAASAERVLDDPGLRPFRSDFDVVTVGAGPVILVRPDGYVAARGRPAGLPAVTSYLRGLFGAPTRAVPAPLRTVHTSPRI